MKALLCCLLVALSLSGCRQSAPPATPSPAAEDYAFTETHGSNLDEQISTYEQTVQANPTNPDDLALLARFYVEKGEEDPAFYAKAEAAAAKSLQIRARGNLDAFTALAGVALARQDYAVCWKICKSAPNDPVLLPMAIEALVELGKMQEATEWTARYLKIENNSVPAVTLAARISVLRGRDDVALQLLESARSKEQPLQRKSSAELRCLWGELHLRHGRLAEARGMLLGSLKVRRRNVPALRALARLAQQEGKPEEALQSLQEAYSFSQDPLLLVEMAELQSRPDEREKLLKNAEKSLKGVGLARLRLAQKKPAEALTLLEKEPDSWRNCALRARAYEDLGKTDKALSSIAQALQWGYLEPELLTRGVRLATARQDARAAEWQTRLQSLKAN